MNTSPNRTVDPHTGRTYWTLLPGEDFNAETFVDADGRAVYVTIIPRLRAEQIAHYASEGLTWVSV